AVPARFLDEVHLAQLAGPAGEEVDAAAARDPAVAAHGDLEDAAAREVARLEIGEVAVHAGGIGREPVFAQHPGHDPADGVVVGGSRAADRVAAKSRVDACL